MVISQRKIIFLAKLTSQVIKDDIKEKFKVEMPQDFYDFWEYCKTLDTNNPECKYLNK
jgi:uncharacterized protein (DUF2344 family)